MTLDINNHIGTTLDKSSSNFHLIELHLPTVGWGAGGLLLLALFLAALFFFLRKKIRQHKARSQAHVQQVQRSHEDALLALEWEGWQQRDNRKRAVNQMGWSEDELDHPPKRLRTRDRPFRPQSNPTGPQDVSGAGATALKNLSGCYAGT